MMTGYEAIARAAAAAGCHCWFTASEDSLYHAMCAAVDEGRCLQPETAQGAAYMAMGAAAAGACPLLTVDEVETELLLFMADSQLPCVVVQTLPAGTAPDLDAVSIRVLLPGSAVEAETLVREAFTIARTQKVPVMVIVSQSLCEEEVDLGEAEQSPDLCKQVEQVINTVGAKLDQVGKKLDEKLNSPEVVEKAETLKKQAGQVTKTAANGLARGAVMLADGFGKLIKSFVKTDDTKNDDASQKDDDSNANG